MRVGGIDCAEVRRHRDENGNNVYGIAAAEPRRRVESALAGERSDEGRTSGNATVPDREKGSEIE